MSDESISAPSDHRAKKAAYEAERRVSIAADYEALRDALAVLGVPQAELKGTHKPLKQAAKLLREFAAFKDAQEHDSPQGVPSHETFPSSSAPAQAKEVDMIKGGQSFDMEETRV